MKPVGEKLQTLNTLLSSVVLNELNSEMAHRIVSSKLGVYVMVCNSVELWFRVASLFIGDF